MILQENTSIHYIWMVGNMLMEYISIWLYILRKYIVVGVR